MSSAKQKVLSRLSDGPKKSGDLIESLGYDTNRLWLDRAIGDNQRGSWDGSSDQKALSRLIESGEVLYRRDRAQTVWYLLPGQRLPRCKEPAVMPFPKLVKALYRLLGGAVSDKRDEVGPDDAWHEFEPPNRDGSCTLTNEGDYWELADGDPICYWAGLTFCKEYAYDISPAVIAKRIVRALKDQARRNRLWDQQHNTA